MPQFLKGHSIHHVLLIKCVCCWCVTPYVQYHPFPPPFPPLLPSFSPPFPSSLTPLLPPLFSPPSLLSSHPLLPLAPFFVTSLLPPSLPPPLPPTCFLSPSSLPLSIGKEFGCPVYVSHVVPSSKAAQYGLKVSLGVVGVGGRSARGRVLG